jgi:Flp pilus assembly secretin CpaC
MQNILKSAISLIISVSLLVGAPVTEKEGDVNINRMLEVLRAEQDPFADPFAKSEAEILVEIEAKILEVDEGWRSETFPDSLASYILNALTRDKGTVLLGVPRVTAKNGEEATITVTQEIIIPTRKPSVQAPSVGDGGDEHPDHVRDVSVVLSVTPTVQGMQGTRQSARSLSHSG